MILLFGNNSRSKKKIFLPLWNRQIFSGSNLVIKNNLFIIHQKSINNSYLTLTTTIRFSFKKMSADDSFIRTGDLVFLRAPRGKGNLKCWFWLISNQLEIEILLSTIVLNLHPIISDFWGANLFFFFFECPFLHCILIPPILFLDQLHFLNPIILLFFENNIFLFLNLKKQKKIKSFSSFFEKLAAKKPSSSDVVNYYWTGDR